MPHPRRVSVAMPKTCQLISSLHNNATLLPRPSACVIRSISKNSPTNDIIKRSSSVTCLNNSNSDYFNRHFVSNKALVASHNFSFKKGQSLQLELRRSNNTIITSSLGNEHSRPKISTSFEFFSTSSTSNTCTSCDDDGSDPCCHPEPEYLEIVTQTAERMRSAVRAYIAEYSSNSNADTVKRDFETDGFAFNFCTSTPTTTFTTTDNHVQTNPPNSNVAPIKLVGILATTTTHPPNHHPCNDQDTHGNERYSEHIANCCSADGILYEPWRVPPTQEAIERAILHANERLDVHGILVFYPVFDKLVDPHDNDAEGSGDTKQQDSISTRGPNKCENTGVYYKSMDDYFRDLVVPEKDVEGHRRRGLRLKNKNTNGSINYDDAESGSSERDSLVSCITEDTDTALSNATKGVKALGPIHPCTALACFRILESFQLEKLTSNDSISSNKRQLFENTIITIINRSEVLGLPLATMLSNQGATVYSVDISSILQFLPNGKIRREPHSTTLEECVRKSSVVVSGVPSCSFCVPTEWIPKHCTVVNVATEKSNFDEETLEGVDGVTYVPHVGRVTVSALEFNLMCLHRSYHASK